MRLTALMCVKNEDWVIGASLRAILEFADEIVVVDDRSTDRTQEIIGQVSRDHPWRIHYSRWTPTKIEKIKNSFDGEVRDVEVPDQDGWWDEMSVREHSLLLGRKHGGTHFAMVDADEVLTANLVDRVRADMLRLVPGQVLDYPMIAMRKLETAKEGDDAGRIVAHYQDDQTVWSHAMLSFGFMDAPGLSWRPDVLGYEHHHRCPYGVRGSHYMPLASKEQGGVMHLQFTNANRLLWKHRWYKMLETIRWPNRRTPQQLNETFGLALKTPGKLTRAPDEWLLNYEMEKLKLDGWAWHEGECNRLLDLYGAGRFQSLDLWGWPHAVHERRDLRLPHVSE